MSVLPDSLVRATDAGIAQSVPSFILTSRVIIATPRRKLEWDGLVMVTKTLHTRRIVEGNEPIWAVKYKGLYYVAEGNHRARVAHLWRQRRIAARLVIVPEGIELTPLMFFAISMIIGSRQPAPRQLSWVDTISNVHRSVEEAKRHRRDAIARNESTQDPEAMRLSRTTVGKVLFGPAFSKLCQDACVDPRRLNVDPLFNRSESGRVFWSGAVRLIQAGIMGKLEALAASRFKLQTKHLRLATRLSKEQLQRALAESSKDPSFSWDNLMPERTTQDSQSLRLSSANSPVRTRNRQARPKSTDEVTRTEDKSAGPPRRIQTRSSSELVGDEPKVPRKVQGPSRAGVSVSAATVPNNDRGTKRPCEEETSTDATTQAVKSRRLTKRKDVGSSQSPPPTRSKDRGPSTPKSLSRKDCSEPRPETPAVEKEGTVCSSASKTQNKTVKSASEGCGVILEQSEDTQRPTNVESGCGVETRPEKPTAKRDGAVGAVKSTSQSQPQKDPTPKRTVSDQDRTTKVDTRALKTQNETVAGKSASEGCGVILEQSEDTQRPRNAGSGCGVVGCKMGATSGMHKCRKCGVDVHPYCCNRILGQPPQEDQTDPIYCSKCWTPSGAPQPLEKENTEEPRGAGNSGLAGKRMEEDRVAVNAVFKNLQRVEGVRVLLGNHNPAIKRDFEEIMNLTRRAIRLTENIRNRIG